jgi:peptidoglycan glycosyltransferase
MSMHDRISRLAVVTVAAFLTLIVNLTYLQFFAVSDLTAKPNNARPILNEKKIERGSITSADGVLLALSKKSGDSYKRYYPEGSLTAPVTGFYSPKYGRSGLELEADEQLAGQAKASSADDYVKRLLGKGVPGNDIVLSLNMNLQRVAARELGKRKGAVVALDAKTGAVVALVSYPSFDPNTVETDWKQLSTNTDSPLINRATQGEFTPGSSFKIVTASAALEDGDITTDTVINAPASFSIYGGKVTNYEGKEHGKLSFGDAFAKSVNTVFAKIGNDLGGDKLVEKAVAFGLAEPVPFELPTNAGNIPGPSEMDKLEVAWMAVGQGRLLVSPLSMALVSQAVANDGQMLHPYLVQEVRDYQGASVFEHKPKNWLRPISPETANTLKNLMIGVVDHGTARSASIKGVTVAGKTGTAEVEGKSPHAWFVGFAPAEDPEIVVAVVVENGGTGGRIAAPVAREIFKAAMGKQ